MIVLNLNSNQEFPIIPTRIKDEDDHQIVMTFTDEITKEVFIKTSITPVESYDTLILGSTSLTFLKESRYYNLVVKFATTNEIIYKDRVFSTAQPIGNYSINKDKYDLPNINNNDYIVI